MIVKNKLNIEKLESAFQGPKQLSTNTIANFYHTLEPEIPNSTINWRIYSLVQLGVINRIGRGQFSISETKKFIPYFDKPIKLIFKKTKSIPYHLEAKKLIGKDLSH